MYLLDTDILVDYLRLHKPAINLIEKLEKSQRHIAFITQFELLAGCNKKSQSQKISSFLKHFQPIEATEKLTKEAFKIYREYRWHAGIEIPDTFVAASAILQKFTLLTRNLKHYRSIPNLKIEKPY